MLTTPDGRPMGEKEVRVSLEQIVVVSGVMIEAQLTKLRSIGVSPLVVADTLISHLTNLIAGLEPAGERGTLLKKTIESIEKEVTRKAGQRMLGQLTSLPLEMRS